MSQHDFSIANQTASNARADINSALQALASNNSGNSAPSTTYANMWWYEDDTNLLKIRNEADNGWISVAYLDGSNWEILDNTQVVNTSGTQIGVLGDQATSTWQTGTGTTESLVSPAKVSSAVASKLNVTGTAPIYGIRAWVNFNATGSNGANQTLRASGNISTVYKNSSGNFTVTFSTAMPDANYAVVYGSGSSTGVNDGNGTTIDVYDEAAGSFKVNVTDPTENNMTNPVRCYMTIVR